MAKYKLTNPMAERILADIKSHGDRILDDTHEVVKDAIRAEGMRGHDSVYQFLNWLRGRDRDSLILLMFAADADRIISDQRRHARQLLISLNALDRDVAKEEVE